MPAYIPGTSWACSAISGFEAAFYPSSNGPASDICGFCGERFLSGSDRNRQIEHLINNHKFGECNHSKKFLTAGHFKQHIRFMHGAAMGEWTTDLANKCMRVQKPANTMLSSMNLRPRQPV